MQSNYWEKSKIENKVVINVPAFEYNTYWPKTEYELLSDKKIIELADKLKSKPHNWFLFIVLGLAPIKEEYEYLQWKPFYCQLESEKLQLDNVVWIKDHSKFDELHEHEKIQETEIMELESLREFYIDDIELDEEESEAFIKKFSEPNPNAENLRRLSEEIFGDIDIKKDIISIKIKLKRPK